MPTNKEKISKVIDLLKKEAQANESNEAKKITAEDTFKEELLKSASKEGKTTEPSDIAKAIISELEKHANEENSEVNKKDNEKVAGVSAVGAVASAPGVDAPGPDEPGLGKTVTTTNEVEKGLVAKSVTDKVNALIDQLKGTYGVGPAVVIDEQTNAIMPASKTAELEKEAAEKKAAAGRVLNNLFEKFATVEKEEDKTEAYSVLEKYASLAEDLILESGVQEGEYDETHIQKVAEALITNQLTAEAEAEQVKQAAYEFGSDVADAFYARLNEIGTANLQKEASYGAAVEKAKSLLEKKASNYTEEDVQKVVDFLLAEEAKKTAADSVIDELKAE